VIGVVGCLCGVVEWSLEILLFLSSGEGQRRGLPVTKTEGPILAGGMPQPRCFWSVKADLRESCHAQLQAVALIYSVIAFMCAHVAAGVRCEQRARFRQRFQQAIPPQHTHALGTHKTSCITMGTKARILRRG
jgi:hypothetical protein